MTPLYVQMRLTVQKQLKLLYRSGMCAETAGAFVVHAFNFI